MFYKTNHKRTLTLDSRGDQERVKGHSLSMPIQDPALQGTAFYPTMPADTPCVGLCCCVGSLVFWGLWDLNQRPHTKLRPYHHLPIPTPCAVSSGGLDWTQHSSPGRHLYKEPRGLDWTNHSSPWQTSVQRAEGPWELQALAPCRVNTSSLLSGHLRLYLPRRANHWEPRRAETC